MRAPDNPRRRDQRSAPTAERIAATPPIQKSPRPRSSRQPCGLIYRLPRIGSFLKVAPMFELLATDKNTKARRGRLKTAHGEIETPAFMPVGTQGSVKAVSPREL